MYWFIMSPLLSHLLGVAPSTLTMVYIEQPGSEVDGNSQHMETVCASDFPTRIKGILIAIPYSTWIFKICKTSAFGEDFLGDFRHKFYTQKEDPGIYPEPQMPVI